jgi:hypothetical protein
MQSNNSARSLFTQHSMIEFMRGVRTPVNTRTLSLATIVAHRKRNLG